MNFYLRIKSEKNWRVSKIYFRMTIIKFLIRLHLFLCKSKTQRNSKSISSTERQTARLDGRQCGKQLITVLPCPRPLATPYYLLLTRLSEAIPFFLAFQKSRVQAFRFWALGRTRPKRFWWRFALGLLNNTYIVYW